MYTKYEHQGRFARAQRTSATPVGKWIGKEDYSKMWKWIGAKETKGEHWFGKPPMKDKEIEIEGPQFRESRQSIRNPTIELPWNRLTDMEPLLKGLDDFLGVEEVKLTDKEFLFKGLDDFLGFEDNSPVGP